MIKAFPHALVEDLYKTVSCEEAYDLILKLLKASDKTRQHQHDYQTAAQLIVNLMLNMFDMYVDQQLIFHFYLHALIVY